MPSVEQVLDIRHFSVTPDNDNFSILFNMIFRVVPGKNFKTYIKIESVETAQDLEMLETVRKALYRKEYLPFAQSFNKNVEYSYLFDEAWFPAQFWQEVDKNLFDMYGVHFPLENEEILVNNNITREYFDAFVNNLKVPSDISVDKEQYKFQQDCAFLALQNKIGRIEVATSGGKTFITYMYCRYICEHLRLKDADGYSLERQKIMVVVPSQMLAKQLKTDFAHYQQHEESKMIVETIFAGSKRILDADIVCGTFQSLSNYDKEYFDDFRFIICDEVHRAKAWSIKENIFNKITHADYFFGMSGTYPKKKTLDYIHIVSMFGPLLFQKTVRELIDEGISTPTKIHVVRINYKTDSDFSKNLIESFIVGKDKYQAEKEYFHANENRTELIGKLLKAYKDNALILVDTLDYCWTLKDYLEKYFEKNNVQRTIGVINYKVANRDEIIDEMRNAEDSYILIGTYGTMSTGVNIKNIEQMYFVDGGKSDIRIRQSIGRGIRLSPKKQYCTVFDFFDNMPHSAFAAHARERMKIYKEQKLPFRMVDVTI